MERIQVRARELKPEEAKAFDRKKTERLRVLDPVTTRPLPNDGAAVVPSTYWTRRLQCGDVELVTKPAARTKSRKTEEG